jgi:ADP-glucose pyrophosphorylase
MGIYVFDAALLWEPLVRDAADAASSHDFGRDLIPRLVGSHRVHAHRFVGSCVNMVGDHPYWRDVGTVDAHGVANLDSTHVVPELLFTKIRIGECSLVGDSVVLGNVVIGRGVTLITPEMLGQQVHRVG